MKRNIFIQLACSAANLNCDYRGRTTVHPRNRER